MQPQHWLELNYYLQLEQLQWQYSDTEHEYIT